MQQRAIATLFFNTEYKVYDSIVTHINYTIYNLAAFMNGDIQDCIDQLMVAENAERLKESEL